MEQAIAPFGAAGYALAEHGTGALEHRFFLLRTLALVARHGMAPLRQSVLQQAAERDVAQDIVAEAPQQPHTKPQSVADSPLVKAAQAYGGRQ